MAQQIPDDLLYASFFFVDIVGLSNPILSTETQRFKIKKLNESIYDCSTFLSIPKETLFILPTGDGMLICFKDGLEEPIKLAIELHKKLSEYNDTVPETEKIFTRIGCNVGHVFLVKDVFEHINLWGPGAILARRVMDLGDSNHILLTSTMADDLLEYSDEYKKILYPIQDYRIKHNEEILVYNAYEDSFGNQSIPTKIVEQSRMPKTTTNSAICEKIKFDIIIPNPNKSDLISHTRKYFFSNNSEEPIYNVNVGIMLSSESEFQNFNVKVFDEDNTPLKITKISSPLPLFREFTVKLKHPVFGGDSGRVITLNYDSKPLGRIFENLFLIDAAQFELILTLSSHFQNTPKLYHIDDENNSQIINESQETQKIHSTIIQWYKNDGINLKDKIKLEW